MKDKLKPCPFCGNAEIAWCISFGAASVYCTNENCNGAVDRKLLVDAVAAWNRRVTMRANGTDEPAKGARE